MFKSKIDLPESARNQVASLLNHRLADCIDLSLQAKQAHWNVKGTDFRSMHKLFDTIAEGAQKSADTLAERLVQLGGIAEGTLQVVANRTHLPVYSVQILDEDSHLDALSTSISQCAKEMRSAIEIANEQGDAATSDHFIKITQKLDQYLWMVEAHLQGRARAEKEQRPLHSGRQLKSASGS